MKRSFKISFVVILAIIAMAIFVSSIPAFAGGIDEGFLVCQLKGVPFVKGTQTIETGKSYEVETFRVSETDGRRMPWLGEDARQVTVWPNMVLGVQNPNTVLNHNGVSLQPTMIRANKVGESIITVIVADTHWLSNNSSASLNIKVILPAAFNITSEIWAEPNTNQKVVNFTITNNTRFIMHNNFAKLYNQPNDPGKLTLKVWNDGMDHFEGQCGTNTGYLFPAPISVPQIIQKGYKSIPLPELYNGIQEIGDIYPGKSLTVQLWIADNPILIEVIPGGILNPKPFKLVPDAYGTYHIEIGEIIFIKGSKPAWSSANSTAMLYKSPYMDTAPGGFKGVAPGTARVLLTLDNNMNKGEKDQKVIFIQVHKTGKG